MLRAAITMQTQLTACRQDLHSLSQQLAAQSFVSPLAECETAPAVSANLSLPQSTVKARAPAVNMTDLFGSDEDSQDDQPGSAAQPAAVKAARSGSSADAVTAPQTGPDIATVLPVPRGATQHLPSARLGNPPPSASQPTRQTQGSGLMHSQHRQQQQQFDPAKPKRTISFNNSLRQNRPAAKQRARAQAFSDAADAAIAEATANARLKNPGTNATELASDVKHAQHVSRNGHMSPAPTVAALDVSSSVRNRQRQHQQVANSNFQPAQPSTSSDSAPAHVQQSAGSESEAASVQKKPQKVSNHDVQQSDQPASVRSVTHNMASATAAPAEAAIPSAATAAKSLSQEASETSVTRPVTAEVAPKLKVGSRLAANMAKLAASRKTATAESTPPPTSTAAAAASVPDAKPQAQMQEEGKKNAIPEDIKRKLLAKVSPSLL